MFAPAGIRELRERAVAYAAGFDPALVSGSDAEAVVAEAVALENAAAVIKALAAKRVAECGSWRHQGDRSPAHQLARATGTTLGRAREALESAERLGSLPAVDAAARRGELSPAKLAPLVEAAAAAPKAEARLLELARQGSVGELADECARTKAAALPDDQARLRAIYGRRHLRRRRTAEGGGELVYRSTLQEVAEIFAVAQGYAGRFFDRARRAGAHEPEEAYLADGLRAAVLAGAGGAAGAPDMGPFDGDAGGGDGGGTSGDAGEGQGVFTGVDGAQAGGAAPAAGSPAPARSPVPTKVLVRVDWDALVRGWPAEGEVCEIDGLGPVPVSAVRALIASGDAFLATVVTRGAAVARVVHLGRRATAAQRSAVEWLNPICCVLGCNNALRLEIDHGPPWATTRITMVEYLNRPCAHHHELKTNHGWDFVPGVGKRPLVAPGDPRHPRRAHAPPAAGEVA